MASALPSAECPACGCDEEAEPCCTETVSVPGPQGPTGADGTDGTDGLDAYTTLTAALTMPAELATVVASVGSSVPFSVGQVLFVQFLGYMAVTAKPTTTSVTLRNLEDAATVAYAGNAAAGTIAPIASVVAVAGIQGPSGTLTGAAGGDLSGNYPNPDIAVLTTKGDLLVTIGGAGNVTRLAAGTNGKFLQADSTQATGLLWDIPDLSSDITGTLPIANGGTGAVSAAAARTALQAANSPVNTDITQITGLTTPLTVAQGGTGGATAAAARANLGVLARQGLIGSLTAVNLNTTNTDTLITVASARFKISKIIIENASTSLTTVTVGVFSSAGGIGTIAANQVAVALTAANKWLELTISSTGLTDVFTGDIYFRTGTAQGAAATANVWVFGESFA